MPPKSTKIAAAAAEPIVAAPEPVAAAAAAPEPVAVAVAAAKEIDLVDVAAAAPPTEPAVDPLQAKLALLFEFVTGRAAAAKDVLAECKEVLATIKAITKVINNQ